MSAKDTPPLTRVLHMEHLVHRWKVCGLPPRADADWRTKLLMIEFAKKRGISTLQMALYLGVLCEIRPEAAAGRPANRGKRRRDASAEAPPRVAACALAGYSQ